MKSNNFFKKSLKFILKVLKILLIVFSVLFLILSILPYLLPVNKQLVDLKNLPFKESKITKLDGVSWHYRFFPSKKDSVKGNLVFIHGFSGSTFSWRKNSEFFAEKGYNVVAVDLPAFGFSEKENNNFDHSASAHALNIWKLLDKLNLIDANWSVCGHSMGAGVAWKMAETLPNRTKNLLLVDGVGNMERQGNEGFAANVLKAGLNYPPLLRWVDVLAGYYFFKQEKFEALLTSAYSCKADSSAAAGYLQPFLLKNSGSAIISGFINNKKHSQKKQKLSCPVNLIWGDSDQWVPLSTAEKFICSHPETGLKTIEKAGHCPMETHAQVFNNYLLGLLERN
jgi:pimeloyl-ACP methyl ester carboxylesterase